MIKRKEQGITLISLTITIIVMIILSAVIIRATGGLDVATETVDIAEQTYEQNKAEMEEKISTIDEKWGDVINKKEIDDAIEYEIPDEYKPTSDAPVATAGTTEITVKLNQQGTESRIKTIKYRLTNQAGTTGEWVTDISNTHTFTNLTHNTTYYVQTQVTDQAGNTTTSGVTQIKTDKIGLYAKLYDNDANSEGETLVLSSTDDIDYSKGDLIQDYGGVPHVTGTENNPWYADREKITTVEILDEIQPTSTAYWFCHCNNMKGIEKIENLNTSNVTTMNNLFNGCNSLESIELSNFNTSNVTDMHNLFCDNWVLQSIDVSSFDTSKVEDMQGMFARCYELETIYASEEFVTTSVTNSNYMFTGSEKLIGGAGTVYDAEHIDKEYAHIDGGSANPGYFKNGKFKASPESVTVIAGNAEAVTLTGDNIGTVSITVAPDSTIATASVSGSQIIVTGVAAGTTYITMQEANGNETQTIKIIVQKALYEVSDVVSGKLKYHTTLENAIDASKADATIKVLESTSEAGAVTISKNLTINTQTFTLTRTTARISVTAGTLTVSGTGGINVTATDTAGINLSGTGSLKTSGSPLIRATNSVIWSSSSGTIALSGGYISAQGRGGIWMNASSTGNVTVTGTYVYTPYTDKNAIGFENGSTGSLTINGASRVGNGTTSTSGTNGTGNAGNCISFVSTGKLTVTDTSRIYAGPYGCHGIGLSKACTVELSGSSCIYANNTSGTGYNCVCAGVSGCQITFNSSGYFYTAGMYVGRAGNATNKYTATFTVTKGHFASRSNKNMFYQNATANTTYVSTETSPNKRNFLYMTDYKTQSALNPIDDCYYYAKGV